MALRSTPPLLRVVCLMASYHVIFIYARNIRRQAAVSSVALPHIAFPYAVTVIGINIGDDSSYASSIATVFYYAAAESVTIIVLKIYSEIIGFA